jgi:hypothetical protein
MRLHPAVVAALLAAAAACGNKPPATDAPPLIDSPPAIDAPIDGPMSTRCTPRSGTAIALRQIAVSDDPPLLVTSPPDDDLDLRATSGGPVDAENREKGLLGLAFHPDYATNRKLYVYYTGHTVYRLNILSEYTTFADDPEHADPASRRDIMQIRDYDVNHNGGHLAFDASGYLVIGTGDGGGGGDPNENGQDPDQLLAKLLRIDVDNPTGDLLYGILLDIPHGPPLMYCAIVGGEVYRGSCFPDLVGRYFFTDYCVGVVRSLRIEDGVVTDLTEHTDATVQSPTSLHADTYGELYLTTEGGRIYTIEAAP